MTRYLFDTDVISELAKPSPSPNVLAWMAERDDASLHIASLTIAEIERGILILPAGRRRSALARWFEGPEGPSVLFAGRILSFDELAARAWARLMAEGHKTGRPRSFIDTMIGAIAVSRRCTIVTGNTRHFPKLEVLDLMGRAGDSTP